MIYFAPSFSLLTYFVQILSFVVFSFVLIRLYKKIQQKILQLSIRLVFSFGLMFFVFLLLQTYLTYPFLIAENEKVKIYQKSIGVSRDDNGCELGTEIYYQIGNLPILFFKQHIPFERIDKMFFEDQTIILNSSQCGGNKVSIKF